MTSASRESASRRRFRAASRLCLSVTLVFALGLAWGPERLWAAFGPLALGPVDVTTLQRRAAANDSLACSADLCAGAVDLALPIFPEAPEALMARLDTAVLADRRNLRRIDDGSRAGTRRYLALTPVLRFPDTVDARAVAVPGGSALALYSRSRFGTHDFGANRRRLARWIAAL